VKTKSSLLSLLLGGFVLSVRASVVVIGTSQNISFDPLATYSDLALGKIPVWAGTYGIGGGGTIANLTDGKFGNAKPTSPDNQFAIPINVTNGSVFFRLVYP
jgi:hypothetical protein